MGTGILILFLDSEGTWCDVSACFLDIFNYITSATTTLICVERCLALYYPLHYKVMLDVPKTIKLVKLFIYSFNI